MSALTHLATEDGDLAFLDVGSGTPIVLLHGGFLDHHMWDAQISALAEEFRVIAPDARGHGDSANATMPFRFADDLAALIRHLDIAPALLVGLSMGAATATDTALEHPQLVRALLVSGAGTSEPEFEEGGWAANVMGRFWQGLAAGDLERAVEELSLFGPGPHRSPADVDPEVMARLRAMTRRTLAKHTAGEGDHRVLVEDTWRRAAGITVPVLAVYGGIDSDDNIREAERLAETVADGKSIAIPGTGHYPNMEKPEEFTRIIAEFARSLDER